MTAPVLTHEEAAAGNAEVTAFPEKKAIYPVDERSGIVIPKIGANASVIPDVDWQDSSVYQQALTKGVAHAKGTSHPGEPGNVFIFAHSGVDFYEASRYNAVFYLLGKLVAGDEIYLFQDGKKLVYRVSDTRTVAPEQVEYLSGDATKKTLTLMTCWPAGTTYKRLVVLADQVSE
jgi:sortase A